MGKIILSVIIPCYNDGKYLLEAIESVKKYEGKSYEIIIINDGSTDKMTLEIFKSLKKQGHIVIHQKNKGPGSARNSGIRKAKGEYLLFLDADDMIKSEYIVTGLRVLEENPEIGVVYSDYQFFGEREEIKRALDFNFSSLIRFNYISVCALVRKQAWIDSRGFDTNLDKLAWEDWIFWLDVYKAGWKFYRIPKVMFYYRIKDNSRNKLIENPKIKKRVLDYVAKKYSEEIYKEYRKIFLERGGHKDQVLDAKLLEKFQIQQDCINKMSKRLRYYENRLSFRILKKVLKIIDKIFKPSNNTCAY